MATVRSLTSEVTSAGLQMEAMIGALLKRIVPTGSEVGIDLNGD